MIIYGEIVPIPEYWIQLAFKSKKEYIVKVNIPNTAYPNQHNHTEIPHFSRDHIIVSDTVKITFNLDIESTEKSCITVKNVGRTLIKNELLVLGSKENDTIHNSDIYDTYKDLYLSKEDRIEKLL